MFILTEKETGGVYSQKDKNNVRTVVSFVQKDDAERYKTLLEANDYAHPLELMEIDEESVAVNCDNFGYQYSVVSKDELIIPKV
tara:strand:- start:1961 stop:2212 length:252 start_codon:yes stop_codon:yes gene_type:complete